MPMLLRRRLLLSCSPSSWSLVGLGIVARARFGTVTTPSPGARGRPWLASGWRSLATAYADQETGERGFRSDRSAAFLEPYTTGRADEIRLVRALRARTSGIATSTLTSTPWWWRRGGGGRTRPKSRSSSAAPATPTRSTAAVATGEGEALFDELRDRSDALAGAVVAEATRGRRCSSTDAIRLLTVLVVTIIVIVLIAIGLAAFLIRRWVTRPIDALGDEVRRVRAGALDSPIRIAGPPELPSLALDVDAMRGRIRQQLVDSERSREAVEQSAAVVLTLRSELEPDVGPISRRAGRSPPAPRAAEGVVAGDCYDLVRHQQGASRSSSSTSPGHGATEGILALRCKEMLRTALTSGTEPGDALDHHRRAGSATWATRCS